ncbi:MAG: hypothetical protein CMJ81_06755 [Planctomycetaceae bacterium]|nr:hypothetical protein [Planctomycetaceae bacterium]
MITSEHHSHAFGFLNPRVRDGLTLLGRRSVLKAGLAGMAGISAAGLLAARRAAAGTVAAGNKSVILIWMTGGPSHIDTWDPKPEAPQEVRGPFQTIATKLPGVRICEYYPKQAALLDKISLIRSVDCRGSSHEPNQVFQTGNLRAAPRRNPQGRDYPAIGSVIAEHRGANNPAMPAYVALNMKKRSHLAWGGFLGRSFDPFIGDRVSRLFDLPQGVSRERLLSRQSLLDQFDTLRRGLDVSPSVHAIDRFQQQAVEMVLGQRARRAMDLSREPESVRARFGDHSWYRQALLARRLVEAGVSFVTIDLSNHGGSGTWDTHGDNIPPYGGIWRGLRPLLPVFDHMFSTLILDLQERGMLDDVLVIAMGEFGRTPKIGTQGSTDGRSHWPVVESMAIAGGNFRHGQVIGASEWDAGAIRERPVRPGDIAATIYHHMGVSLDLAYEDSIGRPRFVVEHGEPIGELL